MASETQPVSTELGRGSLRPLVIYSALLAVCVVALTLVPPPYSTGLFVVLIVLAVVVAGRSAEGGLHGLIGTQVGSLRLVNRLSRHRALYARLFTAGGAAACIVSAERFRVENAGELAYLQGLAWLLLGGLLLLAGIGLARPLPTWPMLPTLAAGGIRPRQIAWVPMLAGAAVMALLAEINAAVLHLPPLEHVATHVQFALLVGGILLVVWGLSGAPWPSLARIERRELYVLLGLTGLALILRVWALGDAVRFFVDEANFVGGVNEFARAPALQLLAPRVMSFPGLYSYWQTGTVALFGANLVGMRAISVVFGVLAVPGLYLLARALFDRQTAAVAALLLATFPLHLHFSRLGLNNIVDPTFGVLALGFMALALQTRRRGHYALAGAALGMTQYFYEGGRLFFPLLLAAWAVWLLVQSVRQRAGSALGSGMVTLLLAFVLVAAPVYYTLIGRDAPLAWRMHEAGISGHDWQDILRRPGDVTDYDRMVHLRAPFLMYVSLPETSLFYGGGQPLLLVFVVPAFFVGMLYLLGRPRAGGAALLLLWVVGVPLANNLLKYNTHAARYVVASPALMLLAAVGLVYAVRLLLPGDGATRRRQVMIAVLAGALALGQTVYYFGPHLQRYTEQFRGFDGTWGWQDVVFRSLDLPPDTMITVVAPTEREWFANTLLQFMREDLEINAVQPRQLRGRYLRDLPRDVDHAFFIELGDLDSLRRLREVFTLEPPHAGDYKVGPGEMFVMYYARREDNAQPQ